VCVTVVGAGGFLQATPSAKTHARSTRRGERMAIPGV
jgi:hypothetical protein